MNEGRKPILYLDFETSPIVGWTWKVYDTEIFHIEKDLEVISVAWSWEGEDEVYALSLPDFKGYKPGIMNINDKKLIQAFAEIVRKAEYVVAHNGMGFDFRILRTRLLIHGLDPLHNIREIDTKRWAKKFYFSSNSQNNISRQIKTPMKAETEKHLWETVIITGDPKKWKQMVEYNKRDVVGLKANAHKLAPHVPTLAASKAILCSNPLCGSEYLRRDKLRQSINGWKIQYKCTWCGHYTTAGELYPEKPPLYR